MIDFTVPIPIPARLYPLSAMTEFLCAVGVVPTRVYPQSGRISALAGRQGRLRACTLNLPARRLTAMKNY
ncbi:hypothetical protein DP893_23765 [Escherichia coli O8]|nr:hypothetical protein [Escherichia coli O8]